MPIKPEEPEESKEPKAQEPQQVWRNLTPEQKGFWTRIQGEVQNSLNVQFGPTSAPQVMEFWSWPDFTKALVKLYLETQKPIVLLFDEFQLTDEFSDLDRLECLASVKALRNHVTGLLRSCIAFGTYSDLVSVTCIDESDSNAMDIDTEQAMHKLKKASPFPQDGVVMMSTFNLSQVEELFSQWSQSERLTIEKRIAEEIFALTDGYPGLVSVAGMFLQNWLKRKSPLVFRWIDWFAEYFWEFRSQLISNEMFYRARRLSTSQIEYLTSAVIRGQQNWEIGGNVISLDDLLNISRKCY